MRRLIAVAAVLLTFTTALAGSEQSIYDKHGSYQGKIVYGQSEDRVYDRMEAFLVGPTRTEPMTDTAA